LGRSGVEARLAAWRTEGAGPLGAVDHETAHFRRYDELDHLERDEILSWPAARGELPDFGRLPRGAERPYRHQRLFDPAGRREDGALALVLDATTGDEVALDPDLAGRATRFGDLPLRRDDQGRPARDLYDVEGRRLATPEAGESLSWGPDGLVAWASGRRERIFAPALPGLQLSRRHDGVWEVALLTPNESPLAVLAAGGAIRLQALYSPTGEASAIPPRGDGSDYPKTWAGYLKYPGAPLYDAGARLYNPAWGEFLEPDPVLPEPALPETWGRYAYGYADPVDNWDPGGRLVWFAFAAYVFLHTAFDVAADAGLAYLSGDEDFSVARSVAVDGVLNAVTFGLAGKLKHLEKLRRLPRLAARAGLDAALTTGAEAAYAGAAGQDYDPLAGLAGNFLAGAAGQGAFDLAGAGLRGLGAFGQRFGPAFGSSSRTSGRGSSGDRAEARSGSHRAPHAGSLQRRRGRSPPATTRAGRASSWPSSRSCSCTHRPSVAERTRAARGAGGHGRCAPCGLGSAARPLDHRRHPSAPCGSPCRHR
jgi:RHS repeat-associated protein